MEMTIKDRLYLPALLPDKGNYREFNLKKGILQKIALTDAEREAVGLHRVEETDRIEWDTDKETPLVADFSREDSTTCGKRARNFRRRPCRMTCGPQ